MQLSLSKLLHQHGGRLCTDSSRLLLSSLCTQLLSSRTSSQLLSPSVQAAAVPAGWETATYNVRDGRGSWGYLTYYVNSVTGETTYDFPTAPVPGYAAAPAAAAPEPAPATAAAGGDMGPPPGRVDMPPTLKRAARAPPSEWEAELTLLAGEEAYAAQVTDPG